MSMNAFWCMAIVRGTCKRCGRELEREVQVNRDWINNPMTDGIRMDEPIPFGYMGDCACGALLDGMVHWPYLAVFDERAEA